MYAGLVLGILRKSGVPQLKIEWLQNIIFTEEFGTFTYAMSIMMT